MIYYQVDYRVHGMLVSCYLYANNSIEAAQAIKSTWPSAEIVMVVTEIPENEPLKIKYSGWDNYVKALSQVVW